MRKMIPIVLGLAAALAFGASVEAQTLKTVQDRGSLICGVNPGLSGFASKDANGQWSGFDVDFCRALAAAIFNDASKVQYVPLSAADRFDALKNKQIDVLSRNSTWTMGREGDYGVVFPGVTYYDGQAFLVPKSRNLQSALAAWTVSYFIWLVSKKSMKLGSVVVPGCTQTLLPSSSSADWRFLFLGTRKA